MNHFSKRKTKNPLQKKKIRENRNLKPETARLYIHTYIQLLVLSTLGFERPSNLMHLALDNRCHESTGAQATVSASVDLPAVAAACGYPRVLRCSTPGELRALAAAPSDTLTFVHCPMKPGVAASLPRPKETPQQVARRFRAAATTSS